ncbi:SDR family oxidoreductase [Cytophagaceae bacterium 50C-KIRBA]|uniref:SDR family oxidoreductase n=1 Tax=Aquirufa beregesia TaxID=2516556 RepID=A0ABX0EV93_9BACT|nr:SDR family oxidoreductase [Aquirufa beregesia]NGZ43266.1 SDR family oxidoreductase [Aquirufa beregesia]
MGVYVIVGASQGIGYSIAEQLLASGHRVLNFSRKASDLAGIENYTWDALQEDDRIFSSLQGPIDGLAYCPGSIILKPFHRLSTSDFEVDFKINLIGAVRVIQVLLASLKQSDSASIVLFSTVAVQTGMGFHASIASSKGAIEGLTRSLAAEFSSLKIRVNAIAPSLTQTPLAQNLLSSPEKIEAGGKRHPLGRVGQAEDIANLAFFLLKPENSWITGQVIGVDGGIGSLRTV